MKAWKHLRWEFIKENKKVRKQELDQESDKEKKRKQELEQESDQEKKKKNFLLFLITFLLEFLFSFLNSNLWTWRSWSNFSATFLLQKMSIFNLSIIGSSFLGRQDKRCLNATTLNIFWVFPPKGPSVQKEKKWGGHTSWILSSLHMKPTIVQDIPSQLCEGGGACVLCTVL